MPGLLWPRRAPCCAVGAGHWRRLALVGPPARGGQMAPASLAGGGLPERAGDRSLGPAQDGSGAEEPELRRGQQPRKKTARASQERLVELSLTWDPHIRELPASAPGAGHPGLRRRSPALDFEVLATWGRARACRMTVPHSTCHTPMYMPVGTKGSVKGLTNGQLEEMGYHMILGNTYHLERKPGSRVVEKLGHLHGFTGWRRGMLTDSGGFQMVSLLDFADITEEGVLFSDPDDGAKLMLTPEESIRVQNRLGADIIMALDDVVPSTQSGQARFIEAAHRTTRWIDRCIAAHGRKEHQNLFAIVQGGLDKDLRDISLSGLMERDLPGYAIGGLAGGEDKDSFWRVVAYCAPRLPTDRPRYVMGIGHPMDIIVCSALGADMYDSVFPTRTARFGTALTWEGQLRLRNACYRLDVRPLDAHCSCMVCARYTRSFMYFLAAKDLCSATSLLSYHNAAFMAQLTSQMRQSIVDGTFPDWVRRVVHRLSGGEAQVEPWVRDALHAAGIAV